jgi:repressor LexA
MKKPSDEKYKLILDFMQNYIDETGYPPSIREICKAVDIKSTSTVHTYLNRMDKDGFIHKEATKRRAMRVINGGTGATNKGVPVTDRQSYYSQKELIDVPVIGRITAGLPLLAIENVEDSFPIPAAYTHNSDVFMLKVKGDSMINAGIFDGDLVLVKQQNIAFNTEIVVALIDDEATVKTFYKEKDYVRLQPENDNYEPIIVRENLSILGKVIGVMRFFH